MLNVSRGFQSRTGAILIGLSFGLGLAFQSPLGAAETDLSQGVVAFNTDKAVYAPDESAYLQMGVVDGDGRTICDAALEIVVTAPNGDDETLSTENGRITRNPECGPDNVIDSPDYFAHFGPLSAGTHHLVLTARAGNLVQTRTDRLEVLEDPPFIIEREGPTRLYPVADYQMTLRVQSRDGYRGSVRELMPSGFEVRDQALRVRPKGSVHFHPSEATSSMDVSPNGESILRWNDIALEPGDELELIYTFNAPNISPAFYVLGPAELDGFVEARPWQLAVDAIAVFDSFTETSDTLITMHTPDTGIRWIQIFDSTTGGTEAEVSETTDIFHATYSENDAGQAYSAQPAPTTTDQNVSITLRNIDSTTSDRPAGIFARRADDNNFYHVQLLPNGHASPSITLNKYEGGVNTVLGTFDATLASGMVIKLELRDATKKVYVDGVERISSSDNALTAAGVWGVYFGNYNDAGIGGDIRGTWHLDDFLAEDGALGPFDVYYSVGTDGSDFKSSVALTVSIASGVATFSEPQLATVGVGDEITYGGGTVAYISSRSSSTVYSVTTALGGTPPDVGGASVGSIERAFTSLTLAVTGSSDGLHLTTGDLVTANVRLHWPCYNDGPMNDTVIIDGYTTGPDNDIRLYTPTGANEVGTSQRHTGVAGTGFRLAPVTAAPPSSVQIIEVRDDHVRIIGIEIDGTGITNGQSIDGIEIDATVSPTGEVDLDTLLIHDITSQDGGGADADTNAVNAQSGNITVKNSILYDLLETTDLFNAHAQAIRLQSTGTHYVHHNTIFNIKNTGAGTGEAQGIARVGGTVAARNNVALDIDSVNGAEECFLGTMTQANNVSSDATASGPTNQTAYASYFVSVTNGAEDLHLRSDSSALWGSYGTPLGSDPDLPVTVDVDAESRDTVAPDIGADEFATSGPPMLVESGTYPGDGTAGRAIYVGFQPDAVFVKRVGSAPDVNAVLRTSSMTGDNTKSLDNAGVALAPNLVQSLDMNGFTVGSDVAVNEPGQTYHWVAFRGAAEGMHVGSYTGDPAATQLITGVGFQPEYLIVMPEVAGDPDGMPVSASSTLPGNASFDFDATERSPDSIRALQADGFEVGSGGVARPDLNANGATFHYVAWNAVPGQMAVGTYTGDGVDGRNLDVVGFFPEWVLVKKYPDGVAERAWTMKPASTGTTADVGLRFSQIATITNTIQSLRSLGFEVGNDERVNSSTACGGACTYHWVAFGPHTAQTNYRSIGTAVDYSTGSITAAAGSTTVMGTGTMWLSANRGRGDRIDINGADYTIFSVDSDIELTLTSPPPAPYSGGYTISRQYGDLAAWEDCVDGPVGAGCSYFPVSSSSLVADDRNEVGIAYNDSLVPADPDFTAGVTIDGSTTDVNHRIKLTAATTNLHSGIRGQGVLVDHGANPNDIISIWDDFVTVEWLEIVNGGVSADGVNVSGQGSSNHVVVRNMLIHDVTSSGIELQSSGLVADVYNNILYDIPSRGVTISVATPSTLRIVNNTIYNSGAAGIQAVPPGSYPTVLLQNNIVNTSGGPGDFDVNGEDPASSHNLASDTTGTAHSPAGGGLDSIPRAGVPFVSTVPGSEDLHIKSGGAAENAGADLSTILGFDIDGGSRQTPWDIGADDIQATTAVELVAFSARGLDRAVELSWETGSEIDNLGFHLYRSTAPTGPYERVTRRAIPGLGSSPQGARYHYRDEGLVNGVLYFYELEDIETTGRTEMHGPISATPGLPVDADDAVDDVGVDLEAGEDPIDDDGATSRITYGDPSANRIITLGRTRRHVVLELVTEGFYAEPQDDGSVRLVVPGLEAVSDATGPGIPVKHAPVFAVAGRKATIASVETSELEWFSGLRPTDADTFTIEATRTGSVRAVRRRARRAFRGAGLHPAQAARVVSVGFQGEDKRAVIELAPLRWDGDGDKLLLARRLIVRISFDEPDQTERRTDGARGRRDPRARHHDRRTVVARLGTRAPGLYGVRHEDIMRRGRSLGASALRLSRHGETIPYRIEPNPERFEPGSVLYFVSQGGGANPYGAEAVYELEVGALGEAMTAREATPAGERVPVYRHHQAWEENRYYQATLVDAPDRWLWDLLLAPEAKSFPLNTRALAASSESSFLTVSLQGVSDAPADPDHHVRLFVNGILVDDVAWNGRRAETFEVELPPGVLRDGDNELEIENVGDTEAPYSMIMLDRYELEYSRHARAVDGRLRGRWDRSGTAEIAGLSGALVLDVTDPSPRWILGTEAVGDETVRFHAESGRSYLAVSPEAVHAPNVTVPATTRLEDPRRRADYVVIGPRSFLGAVAPLVELRESEGLLVETVAIEDVYSDFGFGESTPDAVKDFVSYAYHFWRRPSLRYVLLVGDATFDFKDYLQTGVVNRVPTHSVKTSFLWTASDPSFGAVNGDDPLPDVAVGRLPAANVQDVEAMVAKIVAYEQTATETPSAPVVLVADDADAAGDFEADADALASGVLASTSPEKIYLRVLGVEGAREAIVRAFDDGASLVSYLGHGGIHLWGNENFFNAADAAALSPQPRMPLVITMNCLNGYFHFPYFDSLAEALVKSRDHGAIAAFSTSGLSLNEPAQLYHRALLEEIFHGDHPRLGDAVLASQKAYAETGAFPELLSVYHLFGDPALRLRP